jgi:hypothetical protein
MERHRHLTLTNYMCLSGWQHPKTLGFDGLGVVGDANGKFAGFRSRLDHRDVFDRRQNSVTCNDNWIHNDRQRQRLPLT